MTTINDRNVSCKETLALLFVKLFSNMLPLCDYKSLNVSNNSLIISSIISTSFKPEPWFSFRCQCTVLTYCSEWIWFFNSSTLVVFNLCPTLWSLWLHAVAFCSPVNLSSWTVLANKPHSGVVSKQNKRQYILCEILEAKRTGNRI